MPNLIFSGSYSPPAATNVSLNFLAGALPSIMIGAFTTDDIGFSGDVTALGLGINGFFSTDDVLLVGIAEMRLPAEIIGEFTVDDVSISGGFEQVIPTLTKKNQDTLLIEINYVTGNSSGVDYFSNNGYTTTSTDSTDANRHYLDLIFDDPYIISGFNDPLTVGNLKMRNNGELDSYMTNRSAEGQQISIFCGYSTNQRSEFKPVFIGLIKSMRFVNDEVTVVITDNKELLNADIQKVLYPETKDNNFGIDGKPIPLLFGECFNVEPILVDTNKYEYHWGSVPPDPIIMRDSGVNFSAALTVDDAGVGNFTVDEEPIGTFTGNLRGYIFEPYSPTLTSVFKDIATTVYAGASFDTASFAAFESRNNPKVGVYLTEKTNAIQLLDELLACVRATWFFNAVGDIEIAQIDPISQSFGGGIIGGAAPSITIESYFVISITLETDDTYPVCYQIKMGANRNWTKQEASSMNSMLSATTKRKYKNDYESWQTLNHPSIQLKYPYALLKSIDNSYLTDSTDVRAELTKRMILHERPRYLMKVKCSGYESLSNSNSIKLGDTIRVNSKRYGAKNGFVTKYTRHFLSGIYDLEVLV